MKHALLLVAAVLIVGCVSENTALVNQHGKVIHCSAWGVGWLGAPVAMAEHHDCVKKAQAAGYTVGGGPAPTSASTSAPAAGAEPDAASQAFDRLNSPKQQGQALDAATKEAPAAAEAGKSTAPDSPAKRLEELDSLYKAGLITKKEYEQKRQEILGTL